jgi:hypothetical protein
MNPIINYKRFILKALLEAGGTPQLDALLEDWCRRVQPSLLLSDFHQALRELESDKFTIGIEDGLDKSVSWALTVKGEARAKQL